MEREISRVPCSASQVMPPLATEEAGPHSSSTLPTLGIDNNVALLGKQEHDSVEGNELLTPWLDHISCLLHLAVFAILGVLLRCALELLFGPGMLRVTNDQTVIFIDAPPNIVGCFIMAFVGIVWKPSLVSFSEHLALGLSTGFCGCLTTYASWNQRMLAIEANGLWAAGVCGFFIGSALFMMALQVGVDVASWGSSFLSKWNDNRAISGKEPWRLTPNNFHRRWWGLLISLAVSAVLLLGAAVGVAVESGDTRTRRLWLACLLAPAGAWLRWYLSRLNTIIASTKGHLSWIPVGTLAANLSASVMEAALSFLVLQWQTQTVSFLMGSIQLGFLGSLSTVSTLAAEVLTFHRNREHGGRSYIYLFIFTILPSFLLGLVIYCVPVWVYGYDSRYNHWV